MSSIRKDRVYEKSKLSYSTLISGLFIALETCPLAASDSSNSSHYTPACVANDQYIVISQSADAVGDRIVARRKPTHEAKASCKINNDPGDYIVARAGEAKYIIGLIQNFLVLDQGTGPSGRRLSIVNLSTQRQIWSSIYAEEPKIVDRNIKFIKYLREGNKKICSNFSEIVSQNWTPLYVVPAEISLPDLTFRTLAKPSCIGGQ